MLIGVADLALEFSQIVERQTVIVYRKSKKTVHEPELEQYSCGFDFKQ